jgi:hypothetical protein
MAILLGCKKILFPKKSEPTPTKASLVKYPKKILHKAKNTKEIIALIEGSCTLL